MHRTIAICLGLALAGPAGAGEATSTLAPSTDVNIVTAVDASDSVRAAEMRLQLAGLAAAIRSPDLLAAIRAGGRGRIGFAMFVWHDRQFEVVPWRAIGSEGDAEAVARAIEARMTVSVEAEARAGLHFYSGRLTDLSRAIDHARRLLDTAPFAAGRMVVNVLANGSDNKGEGSAAARDRLLATGATLNGVVLGGDRALLDYFRAEVAGGFASFVMPAEADGSFIDLMRMKFLQDLIAAPALPDTSDRTQAGG
jgi:hypothetical protein